MVSIDVDRDLIRRVARNARLSLTDVELDKFVLQIKEVIIDSFNKLDEVDAQEEPLFQPVVLGNRFRKDEVGKSLLIEEVFSNVAQNLRRDNYFKGPKVL